MIHARKTLPSLYLIRHGQTAWSLSGQHTGRTDIPLTTHGEDEARELVPWLQHTQFGRVPNQPEAACATDMRVGRAWPAGRD